MRVFWNSCTKNSDRISSKTYEGEFTFNKIEWLPIPYCRTKSSPTDTFPEKLNKERVFEIFKNWKTNFTNLSILLLLPQTCISEFPISTKALQEKCFLWVFWNTWKFPRKRSKIRLKWQDYYLECLLKNHFVYFSGMSGLNAVFASFRKFLEKRFW